jgi:hypothetical protein
MRGRFRVGGVRWRRRGAAAVGLDFPGRRLVSGGVFLAAGGGVRVLLHVILAGGGFDRRSLRLRAHLLVRALVTMSCRRVVVAA